MLGVIIEFDTSVGIGVVIDSVGFLGLESSDTASTLRGNSLIVVESPDQNSCARTRQEHTIQRRCVANACNRLN